MISGLINVGMGWKWTLWWCSIFCAIGFVYCFLFMEETNYDRVHAIHQANDNEPMVVKVSQEVATTSKEKSASDGITPQATEDREAGEIIWPRKTYWDKLGFNDKKRPNRLLPIMLAPFKGFTYPPVVYAGYAFLLSPYPNRIHYR